MNYDFLQPQLFILLTQRFDCYRQPSSGILGRLVLPLLASCIGKQAVPYVTQSISSLVSIHDCSCLSDPYGLFDPSCVPVTLSVSHFCPLLVYDEIVPVCVVCYALPLLTLSSVLW